jgi:hypothetical protein
MFSQIPSVSVCVCVCVCVCVSEREGGEGENLFYIECPKNLVSVYLFEPSTLMGTETPHPEN